MGILSGVKTAGKVAAKSVDEAAGNKAVPAKVVDDVDGNTIYNDGLTPYVPPTPAKEYNDGLTPYIPPQAKEYNDGLTPYVPGSSSAVATTDTSSMPFSELQAKSVELYSSNDKVKELLEITSNLRLLDETTQVYKRFIDETDLSIRDITAIMLEAIPVTPRGRISTLEMLEEIEVRAISDTLLDIGKYPRSAEGKLEEFAAPASRYPEELALTSSHSDLSRKHLTFATEEVEERALELGMDTPVFHATAADFTEFKDKSSNLWDSLGAHVGTAKAAEDRAGVLKTNSEVMGSLGLVRTLPLVMDRGNELRSLGGMVMTETALLRFLKNVASSLPKGKRGSAGLRELLLSRGYDTLPYYNDVEDIGSVSYIVLNPNKVRDRTAKFSKEDAAKSGLTLSAGGFLVKEGLEEEESKVE